MRVSVSISRNQLSVLPAVVCALPLKVLIACNNKLLSLPEELGQLRQLTELVCVTEACFCGNEMIQIYSLIILINTEGFFFAGC